MSIRDPHPVSFRCAMVRGFTLIELLVVILIMGIISGMTLYAFGDFGAARKIKASAEQFVAYIQLIQQRAVLEGNTFGITLTTQGYQTYRLNHGAEWQPMPQRSFFHLQKFPSDSSIELPSPQKNQSNTPTIIISPSGEISRFKFFIGSSGNPHLFQVVAKNQRVLIMNNPTPSIP